MPKASKQKWNEEETKDGATEDEIGRHPRPATRRSVSPV